MTRKVRSIATGRKAPTPGWYGSSRKCSSSSSATMTNTTEPISIACVTAPSPRSAKNNM